MAGSDTIWIVFETVDGTIDGFSSGGLLAGPDIEAAVAYWLRLANLSGIGDRVYTEVPADPEFPLITVQRIGGAPAVRQYLDTGNIQIDVWGDDSSDAKEQAHDIAQAARRECHNMEGREFALPVHLYVTGVEDSLGLTWLPDDFTGRERYLFSVTVFAHGMV